jgi:hypothetical protein
MPRPKQIKITKDDQVGYCLESSLKAWERAGWTPADDGSSEEEAQVSAHPMETQVVDTGEPGQEVPPKKTARKAP